MKNSFTVQRHIDQNDPMFHGNTDYYFDVGVSALECICSALDKAKIQHEQISRILDYAAGYGRVTRWLVDYFKHASVSVLDTDIEALNSNVMNMKVEGFDGNVYKTINLPYKYDLIWVGSLFTHLNEIDALCLFKHLKQQLVVGGMLIFTTHGHHVAEKILNRTDLYGLDLQNALLAVSNFNSYGYGYSNYPYMNSYGISLVTPAHVEQQIRLFDFSLIEYQKCGWISHQDTYAVIRT